MVSDCPQSINNIPLDARNHGYTVLDIQQDGPTIRYLIRSNPSFPLWPTAGTSLPLYHIDFTRPSPILFSVLSGGFYVRTLCPIPNA